MLRVLYTGIFSGCFIPFDVSNIIKSVIPTCTLCSTWINIFYVICEKKEGKNYFGKERVEHDAW